MRDVMESPLYLDLWRAELAPGDPAFDFELQVIEPGKRSPTGETVRLSSFAGDRPVALVFGSYT
jgi:hypothetical protein